METPYLFNPDSLKTKRFVSVAELRPINNLKSVFKKIRDYCAGNVTGITRDEKIAQNMMRLLFCKIYDEKTSLDIVEFSNRPRESNDLLLSRISNLFDRVKDVYPGLFEPNEKIEVQPKDLSFIVSTLEDYSILDADRDVIGDAFEDHQLDRLVYDLYGLTEKLNTEMEVCCEPDRKCHLSPQGLYGRGVALWA